jgi:hypothetical protein
VNRYRRDHAGEEAPLSVSDRARLREVERQLREVRMENEFLKKAASYFAQDREVVTAGVAWCRTGRCTGSRSSGAGSAPKDTTVRVVDGEPTVELQDPGRCGRAADW